MFNFEPQFFLYYPPPLPDYHQGLGGDGILYFKCWYLTVSSCILCVQLGGNVHSISSSSWHEFSAIYSTQFQVVPCRTINWQSSTTILMSFILFILNTSKCLLNCCFLCRHLRSGVSLEDLGSQSKPSTYLHPPTPFAEHQVCGSSKGALVSPITHIYYQHQHVVRSAKSTNLEAHLLDVSRPLSKHHIKSLALCLFR